MKGLFRGTINAILQDHKGFTWIAGEDGLNPYNGYEVIIFENSFVQTTSLRDNQVQTLIEDSEDRLWPGTKQKGGPSVYPRKRSFLPNQPLHS